MPCASCKHWGVIGSMSASRLDKTSSRSHVIGFMFGFCTNAKSPKAEQRTSESSGCTWSEHGEPKPFDWHSANTDAERTKVSSQASGQDRVEPKQKLNPSNGDEQP